MEIFYFSGLAASLSPLQYMYTWLRGFYDRMHEMFVWHNLFL